MASPKLTEVAEWMASAPVYPDPLDPFNAAGSSAPRRFPKRTPRSSPPSHAEVVAFATELDRPGCRLYFARVRHVLFVMDEERKTLFVARVSPEGDTPIGWC